MRLFDTLEFGWMMMRAYWGMRGSGTRYFMRQRNGVPDWAVFIGRGREAWRISLRAVEEYPPEHWEP